MLLRRPLKLGTKLLLLQLLAFLILTPLLVWLLRVTVASETDRLTNVSLLGLVFMGAMLIAGIIFSQFLLAPLAPTLRATGHILDGDLDTRLPQSSGDELGQLAWSI